MRRSPWLSTGLCRRAVAPSTLAAWTLAPMALALLLIAACSREPAVSGEAKPAAPASSRAAVHPLSPKWVTVYDPARARNGYTLTLHDARVPVLLDMNGRVVHAW